MKPDPHEGHWVVLVDRDLLVRSRGKVVTSRWLDPSHGGINLGFPTQT
jgi:hypothetical protein